MANAIGCDVSRWQDANSTPQQIDFEKMKAAGADFVFIKASQANWADEDIIFNWNEALAAGVLRGAYHFLVWDVDPLVQADYFCNLIEHDPGELPPVCDYEWWNMDNMPSNAYTILKRFLERVELRLGRTPMIYTAPGFWQPYGQTDPYWARYHLWIAAWGTMTPKIPAPWDKYLFHQYTDKGDGLKYGAESLNIDMDQFNGTTEELLKFAGVEEEEPNMWSDNAIGIYTDKDRPITELETAHYVVAKIELTENQELDENFHKTVQIAHDAGKPVIAFIDQEITNWHLEMTYDETDWIREIEHEDIIKRLDKMLYFRGGQVQIAVHGIMLNTSNVLVADNPDPNKPLTYNWYVERTRFMLRTIWNRYHLPIYNYQDRTPANTYTEGDARIKMENLLKEFGVCTVTNAGTLDGIYPAETAAIKMPIVHEDILWDHWLYSTKLPWRFLYNGTPEELYAALNFEAGTTPPEDPPPNNDPLLDRIEELERWAIEIDEEKDQWMDHILKRVQALEEIIQKVKGIL